MGFGGVRIIKSEAGLRGSVSPSRPPFISFFVSLSVGSHAHSGQNVGWSHACSVDPGVTLGQKGDHWQTTSFPGALASLQDCGED